MTEPKLWGTYKEVLEALDKAVKENPEAFEELEKNPYALLEPMNKRVYKVKPDDDE